MWAIIPVKPFSIGKSRLVGLLSDSERIALNRRLFLNTLDVLEAVGEFSGLIVVSRDPEVLSIAEARDIFGLCEDINSDLNNALELASKAAIAEGAAAVLVTPADLPAVRPGDVKAVVDAASHTHCVVIAPDRHRRGTNALLVSPPGLISYGFGENSFQRHLDAARHAVAEVVVIENFGISFDIDNPEDYELSGMPGGDYFSIL
ncbi:MAG: 2-phospho-L-lactate guanylyltransferase [Anaerolineales bacterium]|nr:2-phospho-L-lactate guanylyltransferase [Anaerolineales bacterium]